MIDPYNLHPGAVGVPLPKMERQSVNFADRECQALPWTRPGDLDEILHRLEVAPWYADHGVSYGVRGCPIDLLDQAVSSIMVVKHGTYYQEIVDRVYAETIASVRPPGVLHSPGAGGVGR